MQRPFTIDEIVFDVAGAISKRSAHDPISTWSFHIGLSWLEDSKDERTGFLDTVESVNGVTNFFAFLVALNIFLIGASQEGRVYSILFFFSIGYASNYFSKYLNNEKVWRIINWVIISILSVIALYVLQEIIKSISL